MLHTPSGAPDPVFTLGVSAAHIAELFGAAPPREQARVLELILRAVAENASCTQAAKLIIPALCEDLDSVALDLITEMADYINQRHQEMEDEARRLCDRATEADVQAVNPRLATP